MSFSSEVKSELCRNDIGSRSMSAAEMYGVLLHCNTFSVKSIKIVTGSVDFAKRIPALSSKAFGIRFENTEDGGKQGRRVFEIDGREDLKKIYGTFGYEPGRALAHHINLGMLEDDALKAAFVRGAFLAGGSVNDPSKRYHLELITDHYTVSREMFALLLEMGFAPKETSRGGHYIIYFKQSDAIADVLTSIGAPVSAMGIISAKIEKDMTNNVNRKVNCDTANVTKLVEAAAEQIEAIQRLDQRGVLASLPEKLRETASLRMNNPDMSLSELAQEADPPVTKSGLNHRLRKLVDMAAALDGDSETE